MNHPIVITSNGDIEPATWLYKRMSLNPHIFQGIMRQISKQTSIKAFLNLSQNEYEDLLKMYHPISIKSDGHVGKRTKNRRFNVIDRAVQSARKDLAK